MRNIFTRRGLQDFLNRAALVADPVLNSKKFEDDTHVYYCTSNGGTGAADNAWQILRKTKATGAWTAAGDLKTFGEFKFSAVNLADVVGHKYNNGVQI